MSQDRPLNHDEMLAVLDWYRAAGVDIAVGEEPVDRFAQRPPVRPAASAGPFSATLPSKTEERPAAPVPILPIGGDPVEARNLAAA
ncbi:MAG TPA: uracil-DNA glycosylase, partial [Devosia sp.]|nr:uracil-DNA glycosylase [Devosia sp.]